MQQFNKDADQNNRRQDLLKEVLLVYLQMIAGAVHLWYKHNLTSKRPSCNEHCVLRE